MGQYDDLLSDIPRAATSTAAGGGYGDLTPGEGSAPLDPNSVRLDLGFGYNVDVPVPYGLQTLTKGAVWLDDNFAAPIARGAVSLPGMAADAGLWAGQKAAGADTNFGQVTQGAQDMLGLDARPADAGFATDVLEAVGGGLGARAGINFAARAGAKYAPAIGNRLASLYSGSVRSSLASEVPMAVASVLGQYGGGAAGEYLGGDTGRMIGEFAGGMGGGMVPSSAKQFAVDPFLRKAFEKSGPNLPDGRTPSRAAYDELIANDISPRPGLVGNRHAAMTENTLAGVPLVGRTANDRIEQTYRQFQQQVYDTANDVSGGRMNNGNMGPVDPRFQNADTADEIGVRMQNAARAGVNNLENTLSTNYDQFYDNLPGDVLVDPTNMIEAANARTSQFGGESVPTRRAVSNFVQDNLYGNGDMPPSMIGGQGPTQPGTVGPGIPGASADDFSGNVYDGPLDPGVPLRQGVPIKTAGAIRTEAFRDAEGRSMAGGATQQVRGGITRDIDNALLNDPSMVRAFPDPADRAAQVERLKVLHTEYAMARADDVTPDGSVIIDGRTYVGGDLPELQRIRDTNALKDVYTRGATPGGMASLQRNMPAPGTDANVGPVMYGDIAGRTIVNKAQSKNAFSDINISPHVFAAWWNGLSDNAKAIFANEGFQPGRSFDAASMQNGPTSTTNMDRLDSLGRVGQLFTDAASEQNFSKTAPVLATLSGATGMVTNPVRTATTAALLGGISNFMSSRQLADIIARMGPNASEWLQQTLARAGAQNTALSNQQDWMMEDANGNRYDATGNLIQ